MTLGTSDRVNESGTSAAPRWESALGFGSRQTRVASRVCCFFRSQHNLNESLAWPPLHRSSSSPPDQPNPPVEVEQGRMGLRSTVIYPRIKGHCSLWAGVHKRTRMLECLTYWNRPWSPRRRPDSIGNTGSTKAFFCLHTVWKTDGRNPSSAFESSSIHGEITLFKWGNHQMTIIWRDRFSVHSFK